MEQAEWERRMNQMLGLVEKLVTAKATQSAAPAIHVHVNAGDVAKKKTKAVNDPANDGVEAPEPGDMPRPYVS